MTLKVTFAGPVPPITGGISSHAACTIRAMREAGAAVRTVSWAAQYPRLLYKGSGIDPASTPFEGASFDLRWWNPASWMRAGRSARAGDLLVLPWVTPVHALPQWVMHASANVPLSLLVHNALPHERMPFDTQLARLVMRRAAQIVVHTDFLAEQITDLAPGVPITIVPHPPQLPVTVTPIPEAPPLRLLCFGFVRDYKGFDIAVAALRRLQDRGVDARLTIAGEVWGDAEPWYQHARDLGITLIPRYLTDAEVVDLVASHHVLVAPYRSATQSGPVSLAFGSGRPVVATSVGGLQEAVTDGVNGRLVPPGDVGELADAIEEVSKDLETYARAAAATRWHWRDVADALLAPALR